MKKTAGIYILSIILSFLGSVQNAKGADEVIVRVKTDAYFEVVKKNNKLKLKIEDYGKYFFEKDWKSYKEVNSATLYLTEKESKLLLSMIDSLLYLQKTFSLEYVSGFIEIPLSKKIIAKQNKIKIKSLEQRRRYSDDYEITRTPRNIIRLLTNAKERIPSDKYYLSPPEINISPQIKSRGFKELPVIRDVKSRIEKDTLRFRHGAYQGKYLLNKEEYEHALQLFNKCTSIIYCWPYKSENSDKPGMISDSRNYVVEFCADPTLPVDGIYVNDITNLWIGSNHLNRFSDKNYIYLFYKTNPELIPYERFISYILSLGDKHIIHDPENRFYIRFFSELDRPLYYNKD